MITVHNYSDIVWLDVHEPTAEEINKLIIDYKINPVLSYDLISPNTHPRVDQIDNDLYVVLNFPVHKHSHKEIAQEIDFLISKKFLLTVRYDTIDSLHWFSKAFEVGATLGKEPQFKDSLDVFFLLILKMYSTLNDELLNLEESMRKVEEKIFNGKEKEMVPVLSNIGRTFLNFKRTLQSHDTVINSLAIVGADRFGKHFKEKIDVVSREYTRIIDRIHGNLETIAELRETNNTLVSTHQNDIMKLFTILAFMTFPLSLLTQLVTLDGDLFWTMVGVALFCVLSMMIYFKHKKWI